MAEGNQPRLVGINHVAIEVGNIDEALAWYGQIFAFTLRGKGEQNAFIDMGDQFINMRLAPDYAVSGVEKRHVGLVVDDRSRIVELAKRPARALSMVPTSIFLIRGETDSRSSNTRASSSPRRPA
jgi:hypothetical protein